MDQALLEILVCPICKGKLVQTKTEFICKFDRLAFPVSDDIPIMLEIEARSLSLEDLDKL
jgi:uncharacterized protein